MTRAKNIQKLIVDLIFGGVCGILVYILGILQGYYIYFDIPFFLNIITPLAALLIELLFVNVKNNRISVGLIRLASMYVSMFSLTNLNYKIYCFVSDYFIFSESAMIDNTSGLMSLLFISAIVLGSILSINVLRYREKV